MTTLAITRSTTALAALYSVQINNNLVALYETAEPLACQQAVRVTAAPDAPIARRGAGSALSQSKYHRALHAACCRAQFNFIGRLQRHGRIGLPLEKLIFRLPQARG